MTGGSFSASVLNISNIEWHSKWPGRRLSVYLRYILGGIQIPVASQQLSIGQYI